MSCVRDINNCNLIFLQSSQYRFKLQKAVMAPLNTLGAVTGSQLQRKLNSLLALLGGETVEVMGGRVSIREHPSAATFTQFYLAKQLVVSIHIYT